MIPTDAFATRTILSSGVPKVLLSGKAQLLDAIEVV